MIQQTISYSTGLDSIAIESVAKIVKIIQKFFNPASFVIKGFKYF